MTIDWVRGVCAKFPHVVEDVKWESVLTFTIGNKMFAATLLEPGEVWLSLKCTPEDFGELTERLGCRQAPYFARGQWVAFERPDAVSAREYERLLRQAYDLVFAKLTKKLQKELS